jgi:hypothetical protein
MRHTEQKEIDGPRLLHSATVLNRANPHIHGNNDRGDNKPSQRLEETVAALTLTT